MPTDAELNSNANATVILKVKPKIIGKKRGPIAVWREKHAILYNGKISKVWSHMRKTTNLKMENKGTVESEMERIRIYEENLERPPMKIQRQEK